MQRRLREASVAVAPIAAHAGEARLVTLRDVTRALNAALHLADELLRRAENDLRIAQTAKLRGPFRIEDEINGSPTDPSTGRHPGRGTR